MENNNQKDLIEKLQQQIRDLEEFKQKATYDIGRLNYCFHNLYRYKPGYCPNEYSAPIGTDSDEESYYFIQTAKVRPQKKK